MTRGLKLIKPSTRGAVFATMPRKLANIAHSVCGSVLAIRASGDNRKNPIPQDIMRRLVKHYLSDDLVKADILEAIAIGVEEGEAQSQERGFVLPKGRRV